jgi:hypothetical protein
MSYGKLNYESLQEEFCYWYNKVNLKFPNKDTQYSKVNLVRHIHKLKREYSKINRSQSIKE